MSIEKKTYFGIDLGTTYSAIAFVNEHGKAEIIHNGINEPTTPSVVYFEEGNIKPAVGKNAKSGAAFSPESAKRVVDFVKRQMHNKDWTFEVDNKTYSPTEISAIILRKVVEDAEDAGHKVKDVVITVPAYFGNEERERTRQAGSIIGLNVVEILDEPVAAALSFGLEENMKGKNVIVYDLGGGTFDVTVVSIGSDPNKTEIKVVCTDGDHQLGGYNWDQRVVDYYLSEFRDQTGSEISKDTNENEYHETIYQLRLDAETDKQKLTDTQKLNRKITFDGNKAVIELTLEKFDEMTADLLERTFTQTDQLLETAKQLGIATFDEFLLVGGSTLMPQVEKKIIEKYSKDPAFHDVKPKKFDVAGAVAKGAAREAEIVAIKRMLTDGSGATGEVSPAPTHKEIQGIADVTGKTFEEVENLIKTTTQKVATKSYGIRILKPIEIRTDESPTWIYNMILKNTPVPISIKDDTFSANQDHTTALALAVYANDSMKGTCELEDGTQIGEGDVPFELPQMLNSGSPIAIRFDLDDQGNLLLYAEDLVHHQTKKAEFVVGLTEDEMTAAKDKVGQVGQIVR